MPAHLNLYISDKALPAWQAFRTLATRQGLSLSQALHRLVDREVQSAAFEPAIQAWLDADDGPRGKDDRS